MRRYWPGKEPKCAEEEKKLEEKQDKSAEKRNPMDRRMARLEASQGRRRIFEGEIVKAAEPEEPIQLSRAEIRRRAMEEEERLLREQQHNVEHPIVKAPVPQSSSDDDSSSESEAEVILRPVFIPKAKRDVLSNEHEEEDEEKKRLKDEERRQEARRLVAQKLKEEEMAVEYEEDKCELDDTDDLDVKAEMDAWKQREIARIKRDKLALKEFLKEKEDIERRRNMTDEERRKDDLAAGINRFQKEKNQMGFLQKYYHKGAFFQDEEILQRDYTAPTDSYVDKSALPEVLQVKNFGIAGRSKWTHLANEDTTRKDAAWYEDNEITRDIQRKMGGIKSDLDKPKKRKHDE